MLLSVVFLPELTKRLLDAASGVRRTPTGWMCEMQSARSVPMQDTYDLGCTESGCVRAALQHPFHHLSLAWIHARHYV